MFSQFKTKRKFPSNKATASARSIQKDTPQLFFEMAEAEEKEEKEEEKTWAEAEAIDPPLTTLLYIFWSAEILWLLGIILRLSIMEWEIYVHVFLLISTALHITNSVFLCCSRVPGRGQLSKEPCSCDRPCCMSKPYTIASAALILPNFVIFYFVSGVFS